MSTRVTKSRNQTWLVIQLSFVEIPPTTDGTRFKMLEFMIDQTEELYLSMALVNHTYHTGRTPSDNHGLEQIIRVQAKKLLIRLKASSVLETLGQGKDLMEEYIYG